MPTYTVEQYELHCMAYEVEAASKAEAIKKVLMGEVQASDDGSEFLEAASRYGTSVGDDRDLEKALTRLGVDLTDGHIPSIRQVLE